MKNRFFLISIIILITNLVITSCSEDIKITHAKSIKISKNEFSFDKNANNALLYIQSDGYYEINSGTEWCTILKQETESSQTDVYSISVTENTGTDSRNGVITISSNGNSLQEIRIFQEAAEFIDIEGGNEISIEGDGGKIEINLQTNNNYDISIDCDWITHIKEISNSKNISNTTESFFIDRNAGNEKRNGNINISLGNTIETISISQNPVVQTIPADNSGMESSAKEILRKINVGWNLGNTLEATGSETAWGNPITTEEMIVKIKELGFNAIRIPCAWDNYISDKTTYNIQASWLRRVKEVVDYCVNNEVYAFLNIHWDGGWLENSIPNGYSENVNEEQRAIWLQIAKYFRDYNEFLVFAGCNEPNVEDADDMATLLKYEQTFIDAVRSTGGKNTYRTLVVQGPSTDITKTCELMNTLPEDDTKDRMILEVHYYTPWQFCGMEQDETWGNMMYFWGAENQKYATGEFINRWYQNGESELTTLFDKLKNHSDSKNIPVIIGEFAAIKRQNLNNQTAIEGNEQSRASFNECVVKEAKERGMLPFYWDAGSGILNRNSLEISDKTEYNGLMTGAEQIYPE